MKPFAVNSGKCVIGVLGNDGKYYARYSKVITGGWVDTFPLGMPLINGKPPVSDSDWLPIGHEEAEAIVRS